jgi:glycosyltransferase involved in cell wall biosynthesis
MTDGVVLSWGRFIRRSVSLAERIGYKEITLSYYFSRKNFLFFNYLTLFFKTILMLFKMKPSVVVVVVPPVFCLYSVFVYKYISRKKIRVILDCHNGLLRREWRRWPFLQYLITNSDFILAHNSVFKIKLDEFYSIDSIVLPDPLIKECTLVERKDVSHWLVANKLNVLVPVSYAKDEPILEILQTAKVLSTEINFILTGNYRKMLTDDAALESGITFTGYLSNEQYKTLALECDLMLCLTLEHDIQMCAVVEAISYSKFLVCSDNEVNSNLLNGYPCIMTDNTANALISSFRLIDREMLRFKSEYISFKENYEKSWGDNFYEIFDK